MLNYDDVLNKQRKIIYKQRDEIKEGTYEYLKRNLCDFIRSDVKEKILDVYASPKLYPEEWDLQGLVDAIEKRYSLKDLVSLDEIKDVAKDELDELVTVRFLSVVEMKEKLIGEDVFRSILKSMLLRITDELWTEQINNMSILKEGIGLRGYGQLNPLVEYKKEAYSMFVHMEETIKEKFVYFALSFTITFRQEGENSSAA